MVGTIQLVIPYSHFTAGMQIGMQTIAMGFDSS